MTYVQALNDLVIVDASAKAASIAGLLLTLVILWRVSAIRRSFLLRARLPQLRDDLRKHVSVLRRALEDYSGRRDSFLEELHRCASTLRWILPLTTRPIRGVGKSALWKLRWFRFWPVMQSEPRARQLYNALLEFETDVWHLSQHNKWD